MIYSGVNINKKKTVWATMVAVVRLKAKSFEWLQVGDSLILVVYKNNSFKLLVRDYGHDKKVLKIWKQLANKKKENIWNLVKDLSEELRNKMNIDYGCINGDKKIILNSGEESLEGIKNIILFTDGLFIPKEDPLKEDDWNKFVELFLKGGLIEIKNYVRNLEKEDPKCWKYPRYKQNDDIAAISITL